MIIPKAKKKKINKLINIFSLIKFHSSGIIKREALTKPLQFKINHDSDFSPIEISQVLFLLAIILLGFFISIIIFAGEVFRSKKKNRVAITLGR